MADTHSILGIIPVLDSSNLERDLQWHKKHTGFEYLFGDDMYAGIRRDQWELHLQFHYGTKDDPIHPSVTKIFVNDIEIYLEEFVRRETVNYEKLRRNTPWKTHEFGFYDLNGNAFFIVEDAY